MSHHSRSAVGGCCWKRAIGQFSKLVNYEGQRPLLLTCVCVRVRVRACACVPECGVVFVGLTLFVFVSVWGIMSVSVLLL